MDAFLTKVEDHQLGSTRHFGEGQIAAISLRQTPIWGSRRRPVNWAQVVQIGAFNEIILLVSWQASVLREFEIFGNVCERLHRWTRQIGRRS